MANSFQTKLSIYLFVVFMFGKIHHLCHEVVSFQITSLLLLYPLTAVFLVNHFSNKYVWY